MANADSLDDLQPPTKRLKTANTAVGKHRRLYEPPAGCVFRYLVSFLQTTLEKSSPEAEFFKCNVEGCGSSFNRADNLRNHMKVKHNLGTNTKQARFSCPVETCKKSFFHATKLIDHKSITWM